VGLLVGACVGANVGDAVGECVGTAVGEAVGDEVGADVVGSAVVGESVGDDVRSIIHWQHIAPKVGDIVGAAVHVPGVHVLGNRAVLGNGSLVLHRSEMYWFSSLHTRHAPSKRTCVPGLHRHGSDGVAWSQYVIVASGFDSCLTTTDVVTISSDASASATKLRPSSTDSPVNPLSSISIV
jgi:hypothetical protein